MTSAGKVKATRNEQALRKNFFTLLSSIIRMVVLIALYVRKWRPVLLHFQSILFVMVGTTNRYFSSNVNLIVALHFGQSNFIFTYGVKVDVLFFRINSTNRSGHEGFNTKTVFRFNERTDQTKAFDVSLSGRSILSVVFLSW